VRCGAAIAAGRGEPCNGYPVGPWRYARPGEPASASRLPPRNVYFTAFWRNVVNAEWTLAAKARSISGIAVFAYKAAQSAGRSSTWPCPTPPFCQLVDYWQT
jgi:hypothetical protein